MTRPDCRDACYPNLASLPLVPDGVVIVARPAVALAIVQQCIDVGVKRVWMHDMRGTLPKFAKENGAAQSSVSAEAVQLCREHDIAVIPGSCASLRATLGANACAGCSR